VLTLPADSSELSEPALSDLFPDQDRVRRVAPHPTLNDRYRALRAWLDARTGSARSGGGLDEATPAGSDDVDSADSGRTSMANLRALASEGLAFPDPQAGWIRPAIAEGTRWMAGDRPSVVFASGPPFSGFRVAAELSHRFDRPLVLDFRDPWSNATGDFLRYEHPLLELLARRLERRAVAQARLITFNSPGLHDAARTHIPQHASRYLTVLNGTEAPRSEVASRLEPDQPLRFSHVGALYAGRHLRSVASGLDRALRTRRVAAPVVLEQIGERCPPHLLRGGGETAERLSVVQTGPVSRKEALARTAEPGVLVVVQMEEGGMQIPSKLYDYLASGNPILVVGSAEGALWSVAREYERCHRIELDEADESASVIGALLDRWQAGDLYRARSVEDTAHLTRGSASDRLVDALRDVVDPD
jgi:hypothetical protein